MPMGSLAPASLPFDRLPLSRKAVAYSYSYAYCLFQLGIGQL